ncbi:MAG: SGNH/GDSL hydrolase family protein [Planctomycetota bacterium]
MRRSLAARVAGILVVLSPVAAVTAAPEGEISYGWHDVAEWELEGRLWTDEPRARHFDRFPAAAERQVPEPVWNLSRASAGMVARFRTDATAIRVRLKLRAAALAMPHMPATGFSGLDLYARDERGGWRWVAVAKPERQEFEVELISGLAAGSREFALYLPLYNGVETLAIGVPDGATCQPLAARDRPIVFYGTSITQGASASRPGMVHVAILGRRLDRPVANLGFSGNGRMDAAVGDLLARVDAACYVIDCLPNMNAAQVRERCIPLVERLRAARPGVPIVLVEDRRYTNAWIRPRQQAGHDANHAALREAFDGLVAKGIGDLHYLPGDGLLGDDAEGAVDGSHPTDLGFMRQADAFEPVLRRALQAEPPGATPATN